MKTNLEAALSYVERSMAVLPLWHVEQRSGTWQCACPAKTVCKSPGKHPRIANGVKGASKDQGQVDTWWTWWPEANVGIATGKVSGIFVIDIDPRHGGLDSWSNFVDVERPAAMPSLPKTYEVATGGEGLHIYYRYADDGSVPSRNGLMPGVDIKSDGGYVVAPPSLHVSGGWYEERGRATLAFAPSDVLWQIRVGSGEGRGLALEPEELLRVGIPAGARNDTMMSVVGRLIRRYKGDVRMVRQTMMKLGHEACRPPLLDDEIEKIIAQGNKYYVADEQERKSQRSWANGLGLPEELTTSGFDFGGDYTDMGLAAALLWYLEGNDPDGPTARYTAGLGWRIWNVESSRWLQDADGSRILGTVPNIESLLRDAVEDAAGDDKQVARIFKAIDRVKNIPSMKHVVEALQTLPAIRAEVSDWDRDPYLLSCRNGVVNLKTGELRLASRRDMCTRQSPVTYDVNGRCDEWVKFIATVAPSAEVAGLLQRALGYSLTGDTGAKAFFMLYGSGNNGKTTLMETVSEITGDYAAPARKEIYIASKKVDEAIALLQGIRFTHSSLEIGPSDSLNTELLKTITGGDKVMGRFYYGKTFTFVWDGKLWLATNHVPLVKEWGAALSGRMRLIRLRPVPVERRLPLAEVQMMFRKEAAGILRWMVDGARAVFEQGVGPGLAPVGEMVEDAEEAFSGQDDVRSWFEERWSEGGVGSGEDGEGGGWFTIDDLLQDYQLWEAATGRTAKWNVEMTKSALGSKIRALVPEECHKRVVRDSRKWTMYRLRQNGLSFGQVG